MDKIEFKKFLKVVQSDERVLGDYEFIKSYEEILKCIYNDIQKLSNYTLDGRFQDILIKLSKQPKYELLGYENFIEDVEKELNKMITTNIILLPMNFLKSEKLKQDIILNEKMCIFLPTNEDLENFDDFTLQLRQQKKRKKQLLQLKKRKKVDALGEYFANTIGSRLDKEHILLSKDREFFNYPILSIIINSIDSKVERESGRIVESIYTILRMLDFKEKREDSGWGIIGEVMLPANTYVVYYKDYRTERISDGHYGYSYRFKFSPFLDINTESFIKYKNRFTYLSNLYIELCFLDERTYSKENLKLINKWKSLIMMFNTAYEFASIEKYDSVVLNLTSILESILLKNEGRSKQKRLLEKIRLFFIETYDNKKLNDVTDSFDRVYKIRNKIMHEGLGYEAQFTSSKRLNDYQGLNKGMKPFAYKGSFESSSDRRDIENIFILVIDILLSDKVIDDIVKIINKP